jgi:YD repeat-containing protein
MIDAQGNSLPIQRNPSGRITSVGTGERGVAMSYGPNGFVSEIADTAGRTMQYTYTPSNRLSTVTDADGRVTTYAYVNDGEFPPNFACGFLPSGGERLKTITYPGRPNPTENFYGPGRRVLRQVGYAHSNFLQLAESMSFGLDRPTLRDLWIAGWKSETEKLVRGEVLRDDFKETRIRSGRYNVFPSRDGYSFLTVHALDASDLFGTTGTVIVLYRFDTAKEWWMSNPHDPFSFGYRRRVERVVSEDEFALLPVLAEKLGTPYRVFALGSNPVTSYDAEWREGRTWLEARR